MQAGQVDHVRLVFTARLMIYLLLMMRRIVGA